MNEETFNIQVRKFLKRVGVTSQRELEKAVREGIQSAKLSGTEKLSVSMRLEVEAVGLSLTIDDTIALE